VKSSTLLIDGDLILYKATSAVEMDWRIDEDNHILWSNAAEAFDLFTQQVDRLKHDLSTDDLVIAFTKGQSFRSALYEPYKAPRQGNRKPLAFADVRERVERTYRTLIHPGLEADDVLGIWATRGTFINPIIVSEDKDLKTIPGKLYRQNELVEITEDEANYNFLFQTLTGDVTDGYPGCPGVGPKTAEKVLGDTNDMSQLWAKVVACYEHHKLTEEDALTQARMARILRASDWDDKKKEPILWQAPVIA
jgi:DNA polymerase-1